MFRANWKESSLEKAFHLFASESRRDEKITAIAVVCSVDIETLLNLEGNQTRLS